MNLLSKLFSKLNFGHPSTTPSDEPDWIGRRLEALDEWMNNPEPTMLGRALEWSLELLSSPFKRFFGSCKKDCDKPVKLPTLP